MSHLTKFERLHDLQQNISDKMKLLRVAHDACEESETKFKSAKLAVAAAQTDLNSLVAEMVEVVDGNYQPSLFESPSDTPRIQRETAIVARADSTKKRTERPGEMEKAKENSTVGASPTAEEKWERHWRSTSIYVLELRGKTATQLDEGGIKTIGQLADYTAGNLLTDIKGIGESKAEAILDALADYWTQHPKPEFNGTDQAEPTEIEADQDNDPESDLADCSGDVGESDAGPADDAANATDATDTADAYKDL